MKCPHCSTEFTPNYPTQVYCKPRCGTNAGKKRHDKIHGKSAGRLIKERRAKAARTKRNQDYVYEDKVTKGCSRCEHRPSCLDYHHLDRATKFTEITCIARRGMSFQRLIDEMAKCILLCANCHRDEELGSGFREGEELEIVTVATHYIVPRRRFKS